MPTERDARPCLPVKDGWNFDIDPNWSSVARMFCSFISGLALSGLRQKIVAKPRMLRPPLIGRVRHEPCLEPSNCGGVLSKMTCELLGWYVHHASARLQPCVLLWLCRLKRHAFGRSGRQISRQPRHPRLVIRPSISDSMNVSCQLSS